MKNYMFCIIFMNIFFVNESAMDIHRIIGGTDATITEFPYQISLRMQLKHTCGGAIISDLYIITAGHCINSDLAYMYSIKAGNTLLNGPGAEIEVCLIFIHEEYDVLTHDIAILKLCKRLKFSRYIQTIPLATASEEIPYKELGTVTGWGVTIEGGVNLSKKLQKVKIPIMSNDWCQAAYPFGNFSGTLCAGYFKIGGKDSCQGDSGGPLQYDGKLFGIVSWGLGCAQALYPGVYTSIPKYRDWIKEITDI